MNLRRPITILGGGLAGLTLGLKLRRAGVDTRLYEAGTYPRHRVCGEFLSGRGPEVLEALDLRRRCEAAGLRLARTAAFASTRHRSPVQKLPSPAWCLSRFALDQLLAEEFVNAGGQLLTTERRPYNPAEPGTICATGRTPRSQVGGWRWFGIKAHATGVELKADLELHVSKASYVGLCRLSEDRVNVCGLFRSRAGEALQRTESPLEWLRGTPGSQLHDQLQSAEFFTETLCTVAGLDLRRRRAEPQDGIRLGDALTMIPPLTGNGMSLAIESADLAAPWVMDYARGQRSWAYVSGACATTFESAFQTRLRWAGLLQQMLFWPLAPRLLLSATQQSAWLWHQLFALTRVTPA